MFKKGFTLIELLVVIAIIGILSAVVLASLNTARDRGADAAVKSQLSSMRTEAILYQSDNNSYAGVCEDGQSQTLYDAAVAQGGDGFCGDGDSYFVAAVELNNDATFCVDSTGFAGETLVLPIAGAEACQ